MATPSKPTPAGEQDHDAPSLTWVTLRQASEQAGVSVSWLRKQYRRNGLPTREVPGPRGLQKAVPLDEVMQRAAKAVSAFSTDDRGRVGATRQPPPAPGQTGGPDAYGSVTLSFVQLQALLEPQAHADREAALLERVIGAEARAGRAEAETAYLQLRLEDAYAELERLRDEIAALAGTAG